MREPRASNGRISKQLLKLSRAGLCALCLTAVAGIAPPRAAAQDVAAPASPPPDAGNAAAPAQPEAASPQPPPQDMQGSPPPDTGSSQPPAGAPPAADTASPPPDAQSPPPSVGSPPPPPEIPNPPPQGGDQRAAAEPHDGVSAGMTAAKLLIVDVREVIRSPEHWHGREWALFGAEVAAVVAVGAFDESLQRDALRPRNPNIDTVGKDFRTFGNYGSFEVLGGFYLAGLIAQDKRAQETTLDGLFASGIAGGLVTPFLKLVIGRNRPSANLGAYSFHPFSLKVSFPSGEATQAFAVAAVIATEYPNPWVEFLSYTTATLTALGRVRQNGHWASDSLAGALIGYHIGRRVVHINQRLRARVAAAPWVGPGGARGMKLTASF